MIRLSSNATLGLKLFLPTFWIIFFGLATIAFWSNDFDYVVGIRGDLFNRILTVSYLIGLVVLWTTCMKLKRVDADKTHVYVSNYFRTRRYPIDAIDHFESRSYGLISTCRMHFKAAGTFGGHISFLPENTGLAMFQREFPDLFRD